MSLVVAIKTPRAVILAADSRASIAYPGGYATAFDECLKLWTLPAPFDQFAVAMIGQTHAQHVDADTVIRTFPEASVPEGDRTNPAIVARALAGHMRPYWFGAHKTALYFAGFAPGNPYPLLYRLEIPEASVTEPLPGAAFGPVLAGQTEIANRILAGNDPAFMSDVRTFAKNSGNRALSTEIDRFASKSKLDVPFEIMPTRSVEAFAVELIRATATFQRFALGPQGVGGTVTTAIVLSGVKTQINAYS